MAVAAEEVAASDEAATEQSEQEEEKQKEESEDENGEGIKPAAYSSSSSSGGGSNISVPISVVTMTGLGLVVANGITSGTFVSLWDAVWNGNIGTTAKSDLMRLGAETLFVLIMSFLAEINDDVDNLIFALFIGLWLVWGVHNAQQLQKFTSAITSKG